MRPARPLADRRGLALLLAVWLLALLAVLVGEFVVSGRVKVAAERNARERLEAYALALAGYRSALAALGEELTHLSRGGDDRLLLHYRGRAEGLPAERTDVPLGGGVFSWRVEDEDGKVGLNEAGRPVLANLLQACGLGPGVERDTILDSILDWRDRNREHRLNGAEEDYYRGLDPPYSCKDGEFTTLEELLLVRGVTPERYAGTEEDGTRTPGLRDVLTVYPVELNAGTAPEAVLKALGRQRPARPGGASRYFAVSAEGRPRAGGLRRGVRAVVMRDGEGDRIEFHLVYWNDDDTPG